MDANEVLKQQKPRQLVVNKTGKKVACLCYVVAALSSSASALLSASSASSSSSPSSASSAVVSDCFVTLIDYSD